MTHKFKTLDRAPVYVKVCNAIEEDILSGVLKEGALLPTEAELCVQFGVTRSSVREGIRLLQQSGLVERGAAKRLVVKSPNASEIAETASRSMALGGATFGEVFETLAMLYPEAARIAAGRLSDEALGALCDVRDGLRDAAPDAADEIVGYAVEFFQQLANGLDNRVMLAMLQSLNLMIGASLRLVIDQTPNAHERILGAQTEIIKALQNHDEAQARAWMTKHIEDLRRGYVVAKVNLDARIL
jgi:GntR family transcriptional regulator, transcriptional repressor for pyruvate dehydrogenase complex